MDNSTLITQQSKHSNELRVFISSTFRDLQEEREHLVKKIFPEIRALCRERGITFTEVDLRWGLTEEEATLGRVIRTCLEEIDKCRPYFIGIIGNRYGWVPELHEILMDPELPAKYPWVEDLAIEGASVTEIEFIHGVFNAPQVEGDCAFFYHRTGDVQDGGDSDRLRALIDRVRSTGRPYREFANADELGQEVRDGYGGFLSDSSQTYVGFDVGDPVNAPEIPMRPLRPEIHHDIMSYSIDQWPSDYTYRAILNRLFDEEKNGEVPVRKGIAGGVIHAGQGRQVNPEKPGDDSCYSIGIVGMVDTVAGTGSISSVSHLNRGLLSLSIPGSRITIRLLDANGHVLKQHGVQYHPEDCVSGDCQGDVSIGELLPDMAGIDRIELRLDSLVIDTWQVTQIPVPRDTSAVISHTPSSVVVRWPTLIETSDHRHYRVEESLDGGTTWFLLAIEQGSPGIELDRALYTGVGSILVRVIDDSGTDSKEVARTRVSL